MIKKRIPLAKMIFFGFLPSGIKKFIYRRRGHTIGKDVKIGFGSIINSDEIYIGDKSKIGMFSILLCPKFHLGHRSEVGSLCYFDVPDFYMGNNSIIREQVFIGGMTTPDSKIRIGDNVKIFQFTYLNPTKPIIIGNGVGIGGRCSIFTHGSWQSILEGYPVSFGEVIIDDNAWLPWQVFVLPNVRIGKGATIGACSMVNKDIPDRSLAVGSPAKVIRDSKIYPKPHSTDKKEEIIWDILNEYFKWLDFRECQVQVSIEKPMIIFITKKTTRRIFIFTSANDLNERISDLTPFDIVLSLCDINIQEDFKFQVFNLSLYYRHLDSHSRLSDDLELFLSRYGIRFTEYVY